MTKKPETDRRGFHGADSRPIFRTMDPKKLVLILGLGRYAQGSGVAGAAWALKHGFSLRIADLARDPEIQKNIQCLRKMKKRAQTIDVRLGPHKINDLNHVGWIMKNPDVPPEIPILQAARRRNIPITSDIELFRQERPKVSLIGVTGTRGKSTTAALLHHVLQGTLPRSHLAGNIMRSPLDQLANIRPSDRVVLELSSWQLDSLQQTSLELELAIVTMLGLDHLYRYTSRAAYWASKKSILRHRNAQGIAILNRDDPAMSKWRTARLRWFSAKPSLPNVVGAFPSHVASVLVAADALKIPKIHVLKQLQTFRGLPGRRQILSSRGGVTVMNDGVATTPEATCAAIQSLSSSPPILLITGGKDKHLPDRKLAELIVRRNVRLLPIKGSATTRLLRHFPQQPKIYSSLARAYVAALKMATPGDTILFSPCGSSFEDFHNVQDRIQTFEQLVRHS